MDLGFSRRARTNRDRFDLVTLLAKATSGQSASATATAQARAGHVAIETLWPTPAVEALTSTWVQRSSASGASFNPSAAKSLSTSCKPS